MGWEVVEMVDGRDVCVDGSVVHPDDSQAVGRMLLRPGRHLYIIRTGQVEVCLALRMGSDGV